MSTAVLSVPDMDLKKLNSSRTFLNEEEIQRKKQAIKDKINRGNKLIDERQNFLSMSTTVDPLASNSNPNATISTSCQIDSINKHTKTLPYTNSRSLQKTANLNNPNVEQTKSKNAFKTSSLDREVTSQELLPRLRSKTEDLDFATPETTSISRSKSLTKSNKSSSSRQYLAHSVSNFPELLKTETSNFLGSVNHLTKSLKSNLSKNKGNFDSTGANFFSRKKSLSSKTGPVIKVSGFFFDGFESYFGRIFTLKTATNHPL